MSSILTLTPARPIGYQDKNRLGTAQPGAAAKDVIEALASALRARGVAARLDENRVGMGYGITRLDWRLTIEACSFKDSLLALERARVAKLGDRSRAKFEAAPPVFGVFVCSRRSSAEDDWDPAEVTIYYTIKGRALTAMRKMLTGAVEYVETPSGV